jgi:N-dimethylarginine dimethylaminohydrolase
MQDMAPAFGTDAVILTVKARTRRAEETTVSENFQEPGLTAPFFEKHYREIVL